MCIVISSGTFYIAWASVLWPRWLVLLSTGFNNRQHLRLFFTWCAQGLSSRLQIYDFFAQRATNLLYFYLILQCLHNRQQVDVYFYLVDLCTVVKHVHILFCSGTLLVSKLNIGFAGPNYRLMLLTIMQDFLDSNVFESVFNTEFRVVQEWRS